MNTTILPSTLRLLSASSAESAERTDTRRRR